MKTAIQRRFLLDNDGSNLFGNLGDDPTAAVAEMVRECPAEVTTYLFCSGAGTCYWPTRAGCVARSVEAAHLGGLDPLGLALRGTNPHLPHIPRGETHDPVS